MLLHTHSFNTAYVHYIYQQPSRPTHLYICRCAWLLHKSSLQFLDDIQPWEHSSNSHLLSYLQVSSCFLSDQTHLSSCELIPWPVNVSRVLWERSNTQDSFLQSTGRFKAVHEILVEELHEGGGWLVGDPPQGRQHRLGTWNGGGGGDGRLYEYFVFTLGF